jgi:cytochrome c biogenesis protein CcdA
MPQDQYEMTNKDRYNFYKETYFYELEESNKILMRLPILIAGLTIIVMIYLEVLKSNILDKLPENIKYIIIIIAILLSLASLIFCVMTSIRRTYKRIDIAGIENEYISNTLPQYIRDRDNYNKLLSSREQINTNATEGTLALAFFTRQLIDSYKINVKLNEERRKWFNYSLYSILLNIMFIVVIAVLVNIGDKI